jgi:hypothetical protein
MSTFHFIRAEFRRLNRIVFLVAIFLLLILFIGQTSKTQASVPNSQDNTLSFLRDVMHVDEKVMLNIFVSWLWV